MFLLFWLPVIGHLWSFLILVTKRAVTPCSHPALSFNPHLFWLSCLYHLVNTHTVSAAHLRPGLRTNTESQSVIWSLCSWVRIGTQPICQGTVYFIIINEVPCRKISYLGSTCYHVLLYQYSSLSPCAHKCLWSSRSSSYFTANFTATILTSSRELRPSSIKLSRSLCQSVPRRRFDLLQ